MKTFLLYYFLKPFKKLNGIHFFQIYLKKKIFNLYIYEILGTKNFIITNKSMPDFSTVKIAKFTKYKNYYII